MSVAQIRSNRAARVPRRRMHAPQNDLLIADLKISEIDGPALCAEVLARWPTGGPRVLLVPGFADVTAYDPEVSRLALPVLFKPFTVDELRSAVDRALACV